MAKSLAFSRRADGFLGTMTINTDSRSFWLYDGDSPADNQAWSLDRILNPGGAVFGTFLLGELRQGQNAANTFDELAALFDGHLANDQPEVRKMKAETSHKIVLAQGDGGVGLEYADFGYWLRETRISYAGAMEYRFVEALPLSGGIEADRIDLAKLRDKDAIVFRGAAIGMRVETPVSSPWDRTTSATEIEGTARLDFNPAREAGSGTREVLTLTFPAYTIIFSDADPSGSCAACGLSDTSGGYSVSYYGLENAISEASGSFSYSGQDAAKLVRVIGAFGVKAP